MDLARASCGTSAVAEYHALSEGKIPRAAPRCSGCARHHSMTTRRHPCQPASRNLGITATLTKRCQDHTTVHTRRRQEDMIGQYFDPPHPIRPLQAAIHRIGWSTATTPPPPPPPPRRNHPSTTHLNLCASCCISFH